MCSRKRALVVTLAGLLLVFIGLTQSQEVVKACSHIQTELVGWWEFDEVEGSTAVDSSSYGNHGELTGTGITFTSESPLQGEAALSLADPTDGVIVPYDPSLEPAIGTFQAWIKIFEPQNADVIQKRTDLCVRTGAEGLFGVYGIYVREDGSILAYILNDDPEKVEPWTYAESEPELITLGEWHQVVMRWDSSNLDLFVDGKKRDTVGYNPVPELGLSYHDSGYFGLGLGSFWDDDYSHEFIGHLDDVRLHSGARSNWQIWADYRLRGRDPAVHPKFYKNLMVWKLWKHHKQGNDK
jgi:hypothetical protein